ncbi:MAG: phosphate/phosphite/phosphonate ABC transporter substrate-binding protein [Candidatus Sericytochromatia bacterium]|nr:phosphate/phosphite/phosphonate ABC transporter substrate-binding protein [Candidatus Tanganyikabacteria bacterium]
MRQSLRVVSALAPNAARHLHSVVDWLASATGLALEFDTRTPWPECEADLYAGDAAFGWICGLPYILEASRVEPLAAAVMAGERYQDRPVYFSDVIVPAASRFSRFADLRGASLAFNEPGSHSGYNVLRYHMARIGMPGAAFGRVTAAGSHEAALRLVVAGQVDVACLDTTVLDQELADRPWLASGFRVIATLGPSPIQPLVGSRRLPLATRRRVAAAIEEMHLDPAGRRILAAARMSRFERVCDADYDPIRRMTRLAAAVRLDHAPPAFASPACGRTAALTA